MWNILIYHLLIIIEVLILCTLHHFVYNVCISLSNKASHTISLQGYSTSNFLAMIWSSETGCTPFSSGKNQFKKNHCGLNAWNGLQEVHLLAELDPQLRDTIFSHCLRPRKQLYEHQHVNHLFVNHLVTDCWSTDSSTVVSLTCRRISRKSKWQVFGILYWFQELAFLP